jgi:hypothetical protein
VNNEFFRVWKEPFLYLRAEKGENYKRNVSQVSPSPGRDINPRTPIYKPATVLKRRHLAKTTEMLTNKDKKSITAR